MRSKSPFERFVLTWLIFMEQVLHGLSARADANEKKSAHNEKNAMEYLSIKDSSKEHQSRKAKKTEATTLVDSSSEESYWSADDSDSEAEDTPPQQPGPSTDNSEYWKRREENIRRIALLMDPLKTEMIELTKTADLDPSKSAQGSKSGKGKGREGSRIMQVCGVSFLYNAIVKLTASAYRRSSTRRMFKLDPVPRLLPRLP
jgi:hypothetical protein